MNNIKPKTVSEILGNTMEELVATQNEEYNPHRNFTYDEGFLLPPNSNGSLWLNSINVMNDLLDIGQQSFSDYFTVKWRITVHD